MKQWRKMGVDEVSKIKAHFKESIKYALGVFAINSTL
jgi:hypothetical protein